MDNPIEMNLELRVIQDDPLAARPTTGVTHREIRIQDDISIGLESIVVPVEDSEVFALFEQLVGNWVQVVRGREED
jgi:hypothetical protein